MGHSRPGRASPKSGHVCYATETEEIAKTRSARICIVREISSNGSSTRSSNVGVSRPDTTNSRPTIWRSSSSHQSAFGYALMSPRPSWFDTPVIVDNQAGGAITKAA